MLFQHAPLVDCQCLFFWREFVQAFHRRPDALEHALARRGEREARDAQVIGIGEAREPAGFFHPVDGAGEGSAIDAR